MSVTYIDEHGHIHLKCKNGYINGYNDIWITCLRCNMDIKYIGSGTAAMTMVEYVTNYIAKVSLDSSTVFSALCAAIKSVSTNPPIDPTHNIIDSKEQARLLLLKSCNAMLGKRELSGQQVASFLCNIPNHFTNHTFDRLWWSSILRFTAPNIFNALNNTATEHVNSDNDDLLPNFENNEDNYMILDNTMHSLNISQNIPVVTTYVHDILFQPPDFHNLCLWDIFSKYQKVRIPKDRSQDDTSDADFESQQDTTPLYVLPFST